MSSRERTVCPKSGDSKSAGDSNVAQTPTRDGSQLSRIPQSPTCRKIFFDDNFKVAPFPEATVDVMEQQKLRWNFDFQTETPLPGRFLWMKTQGCSGHFKNGKGTVPTSQEKHLPKRGRRKQEKILTVEVGSPEKVRKTDSGGSCDTALNEPPVSRKSLRLSESTLEVDWT